MRSEVGQSTVAAEGSRLADNRFELLQCLGRGRYGDVYRATDHTDGRSVAIKTLRLLSGDALLRFKHEFRSLQGIVDPHLVRLGELFEDGGRWFYTMELIEGEDLLTYVRPTGDVHMPRLHDCLAQLVFGLDALHRSDRVHRDVKPSNVLVSIEGRVVLLDFGMVVNTTDGAATRLVAAGTPAYMPPEQAAGLDVDAAADWYAVGVMLYEALTGKLPFAGNAASAIAAKRAHRLVPIEQRLPDVPAALARLCMALLQPDRAQRAGRDQVLQYLAQHSPGSTVPATSTRPATVADSPFVGRAAELETLDRAFQQALQGHPSTLWVQGASGVGKSTLVAEFLKRVGHERHVITLRSRCLQTETVPFKAFDEAIDALAQYLAGQPDPVVRALLPDDAMLLAQVFPVLATVPVLGELDPEQGSDRVERRERAFMALRQVVRALSSSAPVVITIDDIQWADAESLRLLRLLTDLHEPASVLVLATSRKQSQTPAPVWDALTQLTCGDGRSALVLSALSTADATLLASSLLGQSGRTGEAARDIARESGGLPMFIDVLVRHGDRQPGQRGGADLGSALRAALQQLGQEEQRILQAMAIAGAPLTYAVVQRALGLSADTVSRKVAELRMRRFARHTSSRRGRQVECFHSRIAAAAIGSMPENDQTDLHGRLARAMETDAHCDPGLLVDHFRAAGERGQACAYARAAAEQALSALAFERAANLYESALELLADDADGQTVRALRRQLGDSLACAGRGAQAAWHYIQAAQGAPAPQATELQRRAAEQLLQSGHMEEGLACTRELLRSIHEPFPEGPVAILSSLLWSRTRVWLRGYRFEARDASQVPARELAHVDILWSVASGLGMADHMRGADIQTRHLLAALNCGEPYRVARALAAEAWLTAHSQPGAGERCAWLIEQAAALAAQCGEAHARALVQMVDGIAAYGYASDFQRSVANCKSAEYALRRLPEGTAWERDNARLFALIAQLYAGSWLEMKQDHATAMRHAHSRGDLFARITFDLSIGYHVKLMADEALAAADMVETRITEWSSDAVHLQHALALFAGAQVALYSDDPSFLKRLDRSWPGIRRAHLLRTESLRTLLLFARARLRLLAAARDMQHGGGTARKLKRGAMRDITALGRSKAKYARAWSLSAAGGAATFNGDAERAASMLSSAVDAYEAVGMQMQAAASRHQLGLVVGGQRGAELKDRAAAQMRAQGVNSPERIARMYCPVAEVVAHGVS